MRRGDGGEGKGTPVTGSPVSNQNTLSEGPGVDEFKFAIGQVVQHKASGVRVCVVARYAEESAGGRDLCYFGTSHDRGHTGYRWTYSECELEPVPPPKPDTVYDALTWAKDLAVTHQDYEFAAAVRDVCDKLLRQWGERQSPVV